MIFLKFRPGGVLLGILGRGVPPGSPNPDPISDQNIPFSTLVFRTFSLNDIFWILLFLYCSFGVEKTNMFIRSRGSLENHTRFKTIMVKIYSRFQTKAAQKPYPLGRNIPMVIAEWSVFIAGMISVEYISTRVDNNKNSSCLNFNQD